MNRVMTPALILLIVTGQCAPTFGQSAASVSSRPAARVTEVLLDDTRWLHRADWRREADATLSRYAYRYVDDSKSITFMIVDGKKQEEYAEVQRSENFFSRDGKRFGYIASRDRKVFAVIDGREGLPYDDIGEGYVSTSADGRTTTSVVTRYAPLFSPDSRRVGYVARRSSNYFAVVDGKEYGPYKTVAMGRIHREDPTMFASDSSLFAYAAHRNGKTFVVRSGTEQRSYDDILSDTPIFSPANDRMAYAAYDKGKWFAIVDDRPQRPYASIHKNTLTFSRNGKTFAYSASIADDIACVVVNGVEGKRYVGGVSPPQVSDDGKRVAYLAAVGNKRALVVDGKEIERYDAVGWFGFSPDGSRIAIAIKRGDKWVMVIDGSESSPYDSIHIIRDTLFSPNSRRTAYIAELQGMYFVVLDGKEGAKYDVIGTIYLFSHDSDVFAYAATRNALSFVVRNTTEGAPFEGIGGGLYFSPDSSRLAYWATSGGDQWSVIVNGTRGPYLYSDFNSPVRSDALLGKSNSITFVDNQTIRYLAYKGRSMLFTVTEHLE